jgi:hypothetical protein
VQTAEASSGRRWSDAYLALTQAVPVDGFLLGRPNRLVSWVSAQSEPTMLPPYHAGSTRSELMTMLEAGHGDTSLAREELATIACWIDLLVPYCGDYTEANAWTEAERSTYERFLEKRSRMQALDRAGIAALLESSRAGRTGAPPRSSP